MAEGEVVCTSLKADGGKGRARLASCTYAFVAGLPIHATPTRLPTHPPLFPSPFPPPICTPQPHPSVAIWLKQFELQLASSVERRP